MDGAMICNQGVGGSSPSAGTIINHVQDSSISYGANFPLAAKSRQIVYVIQVSCPTRPKFVPTWIQRLWQEE